MDEPLVSPERGRTDLVLFAGSCAALLVAIAGVVLDTAFLSIAGTVLFLFVMMTFWIKSA